MCRLAVAPLFSLGFRPFFLAGAGFASLAVAIWAVWLYGRLPGAQPLGVMLAWHRHEMPFGFASAIIAGFLLTAVPNWTGRPALKGWPLIGLVLVWLLARLAWCLPLPALLLLALQAPFLPLLAWVLGRDLLAAGKRENYPILLMVALLAGCQALTLLGLAVDDGNLQRHGVLGALWLVAALMSVIGGRVIPFFIQRGLNRPPTPAAHPLPGKVLLVCAMLAAVSFAAGLNDVPRISLTLLFALISGLHLLRLWRWHDRGLCLVRGGDAGHGALAPGLVAATKPGHPCAGRRRYRRVDSGDDRAGRPGAYRAPVAAVEGDRCGFCPGDAGGGVSGVAGAVLRLWPGAVGAVVVWRVCAVCRALHRHFVGAEALASASMAAHRGGLCMTGGRCTTAWR
jgi:hypothetical protein